MFKTLTPAQDAATKDAATSDAAVSEEAFRDALRQFASGVTVITSLDARGAVHGMTATAFSSLSLKPPLVLVAVAHKTRCHAQVAAQKRFGVSILHAGQAKLSRHFGGRPSPDAHPVFETFAGVPILGDAMVKLACRLEDTFQGGDHSIFVGLVTAADVRRDAPLVHFEGHYRGLAPNRKP